MRRVSAPAGGESARAPAVLQHRHRVAVVLVATLLAISAATGPAQVVDDLSALEAGAEYSVGRLRFQGNRRLSARALGREMLTRTRPWWALWRPRPPFDSVTFARDLERIVRRYEREGVYATRVSHELRIAGGSRVDATIRIREGRSVSVSEVVVDAREVHPSVDRAALLARQGLRAGQIFRDEEYRRSAVELRRYLADRGFAAASVERHAVVDPEAGTARVSFLVHSGPPSVFGPVTIRGNRLVSEDVIRRELEIASGAPFSAASIERSRARLADLDLFREIAIEPAATKAGGTAVPIEVRVQEQPPRAVRAGVGYGTEDELRARLQWRHRNFLGGGRRLSVQAAYSKLEAGGTAEFMQPYLFGSRSTGRVRLGLTTEDEPSYETETFDLRPVVEYRFGSSLWAYVGWRVAHRALVDIGFDPGPELGTEDFAALASGGWLVGPLLGGRRSTVSDPLDPADGTTVTVGLEPVATWLGGDFSFFRGEVEARAYRRLGGRTVGALRLKLGAASTFGSTRDVPIFARFFAGGADSVRGYDRYRLGRLVDDEPVGGQSLIEGSVELRRPLWAKVGGVLFLDFGQLSLSSFDLPVGDLRYSAGVGVRYTTPVGPLGVDVGVPFDPPPGDQPWQVHLNIGQRF